MKKNLFYIIIHLMVFWIVTDIFKEGIEVKGGLVSYLSLGAIWGVVMLTAKRILRFFTLDINFVTLAGIAAILGIVVFTAFNFLSYGINFGEGTITGYNNSVLAIKTISLDMVGNIVVGGIVMGILSGLMLWLSHNDRSK